MCCPVDIFIDANANAVSLPQSLQAFSLGRLVTIYTKGNFAGAVISYEATDEANPDVASPSVDWVPLRDIHDNPVVFSSARLFNVQTKAKFVRAILSGASGSTLLTSRVMP